MKNRLKKIRELLGYSGNAFAKELGIPQSTYSYYESGERKLSVEIIKILYKKFNVSANYIILDVGEPFISEEKFDKSSIEAFKKPFISALAQDLKKVINESVDNVLMKRG